MKSLKWLLGSAALAVLVANSASAQNLIPEPPAPRPSQLVQNSTAPEAVVSRQGTFKFEITLVRRSNSMIGTNQVPICMASVYHWPASYHFVQGGIQSSNGKCTITLPYLWPTADDAHTISPRIWVTFNKENFPLANVPVVYSVRDLGARPLPANGTIMTFTSTLHY